MVGPYEILLGITILMGLFATYFDAKSRIVPDWVHFTIFFSGIVYAIYLGRPFIPVAGFFLFLTIAYLLSLTLPLGGADLKHLAVYGLVLPYTTQLSLLIQAFLFLSIFAVVSLIYVGLWKMFSKDKQLPFIAVFPIVLVLDIFINYQLL